MTNCNIIKIFVIYLLSVFLFSANLPAFETKNYNVNNGKLQSNKVKDVFFYDTSKDNISASWRTDNTKSWYNEPSNPSDDFTGMLDDNRWRAFGNPSVYDTVTFSDSGVGALQGLSSQTEWQLTGDFDIQISYEDCQFGTESGFRLEIRDATDNYSFVAIRNVNDTLRNIKNVNANETVANCIADSTGRLRLTRTGSNIRAYYVWWDAGSGINQDRWKWTEIGAAEAFNDNDIYVKIYTYADTNTMISVTADNFIAKNFGSCTLDNVGSHTRGTKKEFPQQAILVATDKGLDIIDAATDTLWMRFKNYDCERDIGRYQNIVADTLNTIFALDGKIYVGAYEGWMSGVGVIDFTSDDTWFYDAHTTGDGTGWNCLADISQRNMNRGWTDNDASYVSLSGWFVYDIYAKLLNTGKEESTFLGIANGVAEEDNRGVVNVINLNTNTISFDKNVEDRPMLGVEIASNNKLYYFDLFGVFVDSTDYKSAGEFDFDESNPISLSGGIEPSDIATTNNYIYVSDQNDIPDGTPGSTCKHDLDDLSYTGIKYTDGGWPKIRLWGTASCSALETNDNTLWVATHNSEYGKIYIVGAESPRVDSIRGEFNLPSPLNSGYINSLSFGITNTYPENLVVGYTNAGVTRIYSEGKEISLDNPLEGCIQHNFTGLSPSLKGEPFTFSFQQVKFTLDPYDYGSQDEYGNVNLTLFNEDPDCPYPQHALAMWYSIDMETGFNAFPVQDTVIFTAPVPAGSDSLQLWSYSEIEQEWISSDLDEDVTVTNWNFTSSPYAVSYTANHFSAWAINDGSGGAIAYPPKQPENLIISTSDSGAVLIWNKVHENTFGDPISEVFYNIYRSETPYFSPDAAYYLDTVSDTTYTDESGVINEKEFYIIKADY